MSSFNKVTLIASCMIFILFGCQQDNKEQLIEDWKAEIMEAERAFDIMAQKEGLAKAFAHFAAEDGVIKRGKHVVKGKQAIFAWYQNDERPGDALTWKPTFIDVSDSGDMGYTYGNYIFTSLDSLGNKKESKGIFHSVWKRQQDGTWKFVYD